jgi:hypothetical protein
MSDRTSAICSWAVPAAARVRPVSPNAKRSSLTPSLRSPWCAPAKVAASHRHAEPDPQITGRNCLPEPPPPLADTGQAPPTPFSPLAMSSGEGSSSVTGVSCPPPGHAVRHPADPRRSPTRRTHTTCSGVPQGGRRRKRRDGAAFLSVLASALASALASVLAYRRQMRGEVDLASRAPTVTSCTCAFALSSSPRTGSVQSESCGATQARAETPSER